EHERCFQSNSLKCKHVLSLWRLGLEYARTYVGDISRERLRELELALRQEVHRQARELR
ncbi:IS4 family transposase, partial [Azorhizophilus paspali]